MTDHRPLEADGERATPAVAAWWYPDPAERHDLRYWTGAMWSEFVIDGPTRTPSLDPLSPPSPDSAREPGSASAYSPRRVPVPAEVDSPESTGTDGDGHDPALFCIGDITVSRHWVVTPNGNAPMSGSQWAARDMTRQEKSNDVHWVVFVLAVITFPLGLLLFLFPKKRRTGYVEVTVTSGTLAYLAQVAVDENWSGYSKQVNSIRQRVAQAQVMSQGMMLHQTLPGPTDHGLPGANGGPTADIRA